MNRNKRKILILSDLNETSKEVIQYAITIAKEFNGALELLCVKKPSNIVTEDNPLSAVRNLNNEFIKTEQKAKKIIRSITKNDFFAVKNTILFGNVRNEINIYIKDSNPDLIILGKRQKRFFNFNSDNLTEFVKNKYTNKVCISNKTTIPEIYELLNDKIQKEKTA